MNSEFVYGLVLALVVVTLCSVTLVKAFGVKTQEDFMVAGRKLPWTVLVFTLLSSWIGAGSLFAGAEKAYREGFTALWLAGASHAQTAPAATPASAIPAGTASHRLMSSRAGRPGVFTAWSPRRSSQPGRAVSTSPTTRQDALARSSAVRIRRSTAEVPGRAALPSALSCPPVRRCSC